jgi:hypothetical protein
MPYTTQQIIDAAKAVYAAPSGAGVTQLVTTARTAVGGEAITPGNILNRNEATVQKVLAPTGAKPTGVGIAAPTQSAMDADLQAVRSAVSSMSQYLTPPVLIGTGAVLAVLWALLRGSRR